MISQGQVGPQTTTSSLAQGSQPAIRLGNMGETIVSSLHGHHYEANYRRSLFAAANQTPVTTTVGVATTYVGLCLSNPVGSNINLVLDRVAYSFLVAFPAAATLGIMVGYNSSTNVTHTTPITPRSQFVGAPAGFGLVDAAATLPTAPYLNNVLGAGLTGAITTGVGSALNILEINGSIIIPPGGYAALYTSTASGASAFAGSFLWQEIPV